VCVGEFELGGVGEDVHVDVCSEVEEREEERGCVFLHVIFFF